MTTPNEGIGGLWCVASENRQDYTGEYASPEAASAAACDELGVEPGERIWVGRMVPIPAADFYPDGDEIVERMADRAGEASEYADGWPDASSDDVRDLTDRLHDMLDAWMAERRIESPRFFSVEDEREMVAVAPPEGA